MRKTIIFLAACVAGYGGLAAQTAAKKVPPAPPTKASRGNRPTGKRAIGHSWRSGQMVPTPERYKEIQDALAKKGYLHSEPTGAWNQESADALRRFQQDQNLEPTGKLNSLSIIALGLGPKHEATADKPVAPPQP